MAIFIPSDLADLDDIPSPTADRILGRKADDTGYEWTTKSGFAMDSDWSNPVEDYSAAGVDTETTLSADATAGFSYIDVADASSYSAGHGIAIPGAGTAGAELLTSVASVAGSRLNLNTTIVTTVSSGATVYHDDTVALNNLLDDGHLVNGWLGNYKYVISGTLNMTRHSGHLVGNKFLRFGGGTYGTYAESFDKNRSQIISRVPSPSPVIYMGSSQCGLVGFDLFQHSGVARTSGYTIKIGPDDDMDTVYEGNGATWVTECLIKGVQLKDTWSGIKVGQSFNNKLYENFIWGCRDYGIHVDHKQFYGGHDFINIHVRGHETLFGEAAFYVTESDLARWHACHSNLTNNGFLFDVTGWAVQKQVVTSTIIDDLKNGYAIRLNSGVKECSFMGGMINNHPSISQGSALLEAGSNRNILMGFTSNGGSTGTYTDNGTNNQLGYNN